MGVVRIELGEQFISVYSDEQTLTGDMVYKHLPPSIQYMNLQDLDTGATTLRSQPCCSGDHVDRLIFHPFGCKATTGHIHIIVPEKPVQRLHYNQCMEALIKAGIITSPQDLQSASSGTAPNNVQITLLEDTAPIGMSQAERHAKLLVSDNLLQERIWHTRTYREAFPEDFQSDQQE